MDGQKIWEQRQKTEDWLSGAYYWQEHFVKTSENPGWQGKVRCRYCKTSGWPQYDDFNTKWWGHKHGQNCKWKELWDLKNKPTQYYYGLTTSSNTNWTIGTTSATGTYTIKYP